MFSSPHIAAQLAGERHRDLLRAGESARAARAASSANQLAPAAPDGIAAQAHLDARPAKAQVSPRPRLHAARIRVPRRIRRGRARSGARLDA